MKEYFGLQYTMTNRWFKDAGLQPLLAYLILTVGFVGLSFYLFQKPEFAEYIYLLLAVALIGKLSETRRTDFLKICFGDEKLKKIRIAENLICSIPFVTFLLLKHFFISALILLILAAILALIHFRTSLHFTIWTPFSKSPFEFTTGFRKSFYLFLIVYALTVISISVNNFNLGIFAMLLTFATTLSYYTKPENEYFVWIYSVNAKRFLFRKIKTAMLFSAALALPIAIVLAIFFHENIGILSLSFLIGWAFLMCIILSKYSAYPNEMNITQGIFLALSVWFPPILIVLIPFLFIKSQNRLSGLLK